MGRITTLRVQNFKSIKELVEVKFPEASPLVLVGENNTGKSNLVRAIELLLGESWPGSYEPEDHDFHNRDKTNSPIKIQVGLEGVHHLDRRGISSDVSQLSLCYPSDDDHTLHMVLDGTRESAFVSNEVREQCVCIVVGADRRLAYQLSYTSKYTFLSKLMHKFHQTLTSDQQRVTDVKAKFEEVKSLFQGVQPFAVFEGELQKQIEELSGNLEYRLGVDFSAYDPSNYFHALRVLPHQGDKVRTFEELGTGQEQLLALSFAYAYAKAFHGEGCGLIVVIEEPEAHLHPLAQKWVGQKIHALAKEGVQVVVTTHSPAFLNVLNLEGITLLRKVRNATIAKQLSRSELAQHCRNHGAAKATDDSILPFYAAAATEEILAGFFARVVVLVEGPTEALALPIYFSRVGLDPTKEGIAILPVHGVGNLAKWWRLYTAYSLPVYLVFDNDAEDDPDCLKRKDVLQTLTVPPQTFEALLNGAAWVIEDHFAIFGVNFENTMRLSFGDAYVNLEEEAKREYSLAANQSKPLIARYVAQHLEYDVQQEGWRRIKALAEKIRGNNTHPSDVDADPET